MRTTNKKPLEAVKAYERTLTLARRLPVGPGQLRDFQHVLRMHIDSLQAISKMATFFQIKAQAQARKRSGGGGGGGGFIDCQQGM